VLFKLEPYTERGLSISRINYNFLKEYSLYLKTKEKLTAEELKRIFTNPLPQIPSLLLARDFFLACFLAEGTSGIMNGIKTIESMEHLEENHLNSTAAKMTLYPDPIKLKKYPISSQILTPFCPKIKGSIQYHSTRYF
jgi:hypothetical protein